MLKEIDKDINNCIKGLTLVSNRNNKQKAKYYTNGNPFNHVFFKEWLSIIPNYQNKRVLEPFSGSNNIIELVKQIDDDINN